MTPVPYFKAKALAEAFSLKKSIPEAVYVAGGTDLMVRVKHRQIRPKALISLRSVKELQGIKVGRSTVRIGAGATIAELIGSADLRRACPLLVQAARQLGSAQIRNVATIGGNLCNASPCADTATPLLVMEAEVEVRSPRGRRRLPMDRFFKGVKTCALKKDEILTAVVVRPPGPNVRARFLKKGRVKLDLAVASVSVLLDVKGLKCRKARIAAGSVAASPIRLRAAEAVLEDSVLTPQLAIEAARIASESVAPITDVRSTEAYRREIVGVYVKRAVHELMGWVDS